MQGALAQNSVRWSVFENQLEEDWLAHIQAGAEGSGIKAKRILQWNEEWETFCQWIIQEFGSDC
jgi:adenosine deaminase CECR1